VSEIRQQLLETVIALREEAGKNLDRDAVPVYLFLAERFKASKDVRSDHVFQFVFRSFYRLDSGGLSDAFKGAYFELLQKYRHGPLPDLRQLCEVLRQFPTKKGGNSLQFSFATKLLATLDPEQPIYDSLVASLFGYKRPDHLKDFSKRLEKLCSFYKSLSETSRWLAQRTEFCVVRAAFSEHEQWDELPPMKQIDFILWATGKAVSKQATTESPPTPYRSRLSESGWRGSATLG
jgi:hypothetical protein